MALVKVEFVFSKTEEQIVQLIKETGNKTVKELVVKVGKSAEEIISNIGNLVRSETLVLEGIPKRPTYGLTGFYCRYR